VYEIDGFEIEGRKVGPSHPPFFIAEISANHGGSLESALSLVEAASDAGASAVKLQHYRPDTITVRSALPEFRVSGGTLWDDQQLYDLYESAMTPWEWTSEIFSYAAELGILCFSSPFDFSAVDFLESHHVAAYKVASFELVDLPLIRYIASTGKPMIMSTGMATVEEVDAAVSTAREAGAASVALLRCNSGYPASPSEMDLAAIPFMRDRWNCQIGLSDHTLSSVASISAVALGATIIEKHIIGKRSDGGPDSEFSCEPTEMKALIEDVNTAWASLGTVRFGPSPREISSIAFRRSLRASRGIKNGELISTDNVRSMRPAGGLPPIELDHLIGKKVNVDLDVGAAITWSVVE
jgi:N-acetylneuraminate synthase